jgi:hypothetical protein
MCVRSLKVLKNQLMLLLALVGLYALLSALKMV